MTSRPNPVDDAPSEGVTGAGGVSDEMAPAARLPVASEPVFTTFGGAGAGGANADEAGGAEPAGALPRAGASATGGAKGNAGSTGAPGGANAAGGLAAAGGSVSGGEQNGGGGATAGAALLFSEYVEGTGSFKALEIYALEASSLEGCELQTYSNGKLEPSRLALHGALAQGEVQVLCSSALALQQPSACSRTTNLSFNGDDALALGCAGQLLDVIGQIGVDPGDSWGLGATLDHTLRRRCEVTAGRSDGSAPFEIDGEWLTLGADTFSDLGVRHCAPR